MTRTTVTRVFVLAVAIGLANAAMADDLSPPSWRFNAGTTVQHWDFSSGPLGFAPDALPLNNIYGSPTMTPTTGTFWMPSGFGRNDIWAIAGGALQFDIPNTGNTAHQKELWLQVTFLANAAVPPPSYNVASTTGLFTQIGGPINTFLPNNWVHQLTIWSFPVCPQFERISIFPGLAGAQVLIDQVVIDTQCTVPAPGAAALLGLAGLCAGRRRR